MVNAFNITISNVYHYNIDLYAWQEGCYIIKYTFIINMSANIEKKEEDHSWKTIVDNGTAISCL